MRSSIKIRARSPELVDALGSRLPSNFLTMYPIISHLHRVFFEEATALTRVAIKKRSDEMYKAAAVKYQQALERKPDDYKSLSNWGFSLFMQATQKVASFDGTQPEQLFAIDGLFQEAEKKYEEALGVEPNDYKTLKKLAQCLNERASLLKFWGNPIARDYFLESRKQLSRARESNPLDYEIFLIFGDVLFRQARAFSEEAPVLLQESCLHYETADKLKPNNEDTLINWATAEHSLSIYKQKQEQIQLIQHAGELLQQLLEKKIGDPKRSQVLLVYGQVLCSLAGIADFSDVKLLCQAGVSFASAASLNKTNERIQLAWLKFLTHLLNHPSLLLENIRNLSSALAQFEPKTEQISLLSEFLALDSTNQFATFISFLEDSQKEKSESSSLEISTDHENNLNFLETISTKIINYQQSSKPPEKDVFSFIQTVGGGRGSCKLYLIFLSALFFLV